MNTGYIRLLLLAGSIATFDIPVWFLGFYIPSAILDGKLNFDLIVYKCELVFFLEI